MNLYDGEIVNIAKNIIIQRFSISDELAEQYAIQAIEALISHGGDPKNFESIISVIEVVVKSWIEEDK